MENLNELIRRLRTTKEPMPPHEQLIRDIREVRQQLDGVQSYFALETDEDLLEAAIYQRDALEARYRYLLRQAKEREAVAVHAPVVQEDRERWIN
jgi:hypothetical protein